MLNFLCSLIVNEVITCGLPKSLVYCTVERTVQYRRVSGFKTLSITPVWPIYGPLVSRPNVRGTQRKCFLDVHASFSSVGKYGLYVFIRAVGITHQL